MMKKLPKNRNQRLLLMGAGFIVAITLLAFIVGNITFQQVTYQSNAGFEVILIFDDRGVATITQLSEFSYHVDNKSESIYLEIDVDSSAGTVNYVEITKRAEGSAAEVLVTDHPTVSHITYTFTIFNLPTTYTFQVHARTEGVGVIDTITFTVECAGYGTAAPPPPLTSPEVTNDFDIAGFELFTLISIIALIKKRKQ